MPTDCPASPTGGGATGEPSHVTDLLPLPLPLPLQSSAEVRREGGSGRELARAAQSGTLVRIRRGAYVDTEPWRDLRAEQQHLLRVAATDNAALGRPVFSHESAAAVWKIPLVGGWPGKPVITVAPGAGLRSNRVVSRIESLLDPTEIVRSGQFLVTSPGRTVIDLATTRSFLSAACAIEHALSQKLCTREHLERLIHRRRPFRGVRKADAVLGFASTRSGSPAETLCRVRFAELGYPQPLQQKRYDSIGGSWYEVDFYWPDFDVIGETDGRVKYESPEFLAGRTPEQALWEEKLREDELRAQCSAFVRLTWDDAWNRAGLIAKLTRAGIPRRP